MHKDEKRAEPLQLEFRIGPGPRNLKHPAVVPGANEVGICHLLQDQASPPSSSSLDHKLPGTKEAARPASCLPSRIPDRRLAATLKLLRLLEHCMAKALPTPLPATREELLHGIVARRCGFRSTWHMTGCRLWPPSSVKEKPKQRWSAQHSAFRYSTACDF